MSQLLKAFWSDEKGHGVMEYVVLVGLSTIVGATVLTGVRDQTLSILQSLSDVLTEAGFSAAS